MAAGLGRKMVHDAYQRRACMCCSRRDVCFGGHMEENEVVVLLPYFLSIYTRTNTRYILFIQRVSKSPCFGRRYTQRALLLIVHMRRACLAGSVILPWTLSYVRLAMLSFFSMLDVCVWECVSTGGILAFALGPSRLVPLRCFLCTSCDFLSFCICDKGHMTVTHTR